MKEAKGLFDKKLSPDAKKLLEQMEKVHGTDQFDKAAGQFIEKFGFPEQWRTLLLLMDIKNPEIFEQAIDRMVAKYKEQNMTDRRSFKSKLSIVLNTANSTKIRMIAKKAQDNI